MNAKTKKNSKFKHALYSTLSVALSLAVYFVILLFSSGCAANERIVIKNELAETLIPVSSNITSPVIADYIEYDDNDTDDEIHLKRLQNRSNIFIYNEELENTNKAHKGNL